MRADFDLAELDTEAANFDLIVISAQKLDIAIAKEARPIARLVEARPIGSEGVQDKPGFGQSGAVAVSARQAVAAQVQLTRLTWRDGNHVFVEDIDFSSRDRPANGNRVGELLLIARDAIATSKRGGLGGAIAVDQLRARQQFQRPRHMRDRKGLAAGKDFLDGLQNGGIVIDDRVK